MKRNRLLTILVCWLMLAAGGGLALAQETKPPQTGRPAEAEPKPDGQTPNFAISETGFGSVVVKGAPYVVEAEIETTQTLGDGNHVTRKIPTLIWRDGEGRMRREQTLTSVGPWPVAGEAPRTILITDPVAGVKYQLDPRKRTARKLPFKPVEIVAEGKAPAPSASSSSYPTKRELIGKQTMAGVLATGVRTITTIPAGAAGNERPIEIVSERWVAEELRALMLTRHNDPRFGETVYRVTRITRAEPARTLFELPAGYTVKDETAPRKPPAKSSPKRPDE